MRFQVPQFIEVEDRIFGQLTLKQFIYIAGGLGLAAVIYFVFDSLFIAVVPGVIVIGASVALAFYKVNNKPLINVVEAALRYWVGNKLYIWKKEDKKRVPTPAEELRQAKNYASVMVPKISDSKLKDLSWSLDIKESIYSDRKQR